MAEAAIPCGHAEDPIEDSGVEDDAAAASIQGFPV